MRSEIPVMDWYLVVITILSVMALITTFRRRTENRQANIFLALLFWSYWYTILVGYFTMSRIIDNVPHFFRTAHITTLIFMPASWLYLQLSLYPRSLKRTDLIHLLPLAVYLIDYFPFWILGGREKLDILYSMNAVGLHWNYKEGWFMPSGGHVFIRYLSMAAYWLAQIILIRKFNTEKKEPVKRTQRSFIRWTKWVVICEFLIIVPSVLGLFFGSSHYSVFLFQMSSLFGAMALSIYLVFQPDILYGLEYWTKMMGSPVQFEEPSDGKPFMTTSEPRAAYLHQNNKPKSPNIILSPDLNREISVKLDHLMEYQMPYLKQKYSLKDLATETGFSIHQLSAYINKELGMNFYEYINRLRIESCIPKLEAMEFRNKTLEAIAGECGFQNRVTFIRAFKKHKGSTPSDYIKSIQSNTGQSCVNG